MTASASLPGRLLREPAIQFLLLGAVLFAVFAWRNEPATAPAATEDRRIEIAEADARRLIGQFEAVWRRPPTAEELDALLDDYLDEELLVREARALGLDRGDAAIRGRLRQKMLFLTESAARSLDPDDAVLADHLRAHADRFALPPRLSFDQVLLGETADDATVARIRAALSEGQPAEALSRSALLPTRIDGAAPAQVDGMFGTGFFDRVAATAPGDWQGPVRSGYGLHLVRVAALDRPPPPTLAEIRDTVLADWRRGQIETLTAARIADLRRDYDIVLPPPEALRALLAP